VVAKITFFNQQKNFNFAQNIWVKAIEYEKSKKC